MDHVEVRSGEKTLENDTVVYVDHVKFRPSVENLEDDDLVHADHVDLRVGMKNLEEPQRSPPGSRESSCGREKPRG